MMRAIAAVSILILVVPLACEPDAARSAQAVAQAADTRSAADSLIFRRVWAGREPDFYASSPSPDGRYVTEVDWATGDLALIDLVTGEMKHVTGKGSWDESASWAESSVFSPDGRRIAYTWFNVDGGGYEIRMVNPDGTEPDVLVQHQPDVAYFLIEDWSRDGASLLVQVRRTDGTTELALVSASDGSIRVLRELSGEDYAGMAALSPDGRYLAWDQPSQKDSRENDIYALAVGGGREVRLLGGPSDDRLMGWTPDGGSILFSSDRELTQGIWRLPVTGPLTVGEPELLRPDVWRLSPLGFSRDACFYGVAVEEPQVYTAAIDVPSGRIVSTPTPVQDVSAEMSVAGDWSPDGRYLAYVTSPFQRASRLVIRAVTGDDTREIPLGFPSVRLLRWTPDSKAVMVVTRGDDPNPVLFRVDLTTGRIEQVLAKQGDWELIRSDFSPDGRTLYIVRMLDLNHLGFPGDGRIVAHDMSTGAETEIAAVGWIGSLSVSPDGRTLAALELNASENESRLITIPVSGGEPRELYRASDRWAFETMAGLPWTPDGRYILAVRRGDTQGTLMKVPATGGEPLEIGEIPFSIDWRRLRLHPDGNRIAFNAGDAKGEIWMIQNLSGVRGTEASRPAR